MKEQHPTAAEIAALGEALLEAPEAGQVREHVTHCATCSGTVEDLRLVRSELASLYPDTPMPDRLAARIDGALASEPHPVSRETTGSARQGRRRHFMLVAGGAVVALAIGAIVAQTAGSPDNQETATGSAQESHDAPQRNDAATEDDSEAAAEETREHAADGDADVLLKAEVQELLEGTPEQDEPDEASPSGDEQEPGILDSDPSEESAEQPPQDGLGSTDESPREAVPSCVTSVIDQDEAPIASSSDYHHDGTVSYLVVFPRSDEPSVVDAYVVDAACTNGAAPSSEDILEKQSYPRESS